MGFLVDFLVVEGEEGSKYEAKHHRAASETPFK